MGRLSLGVVGVKGRSDGATMRIAVGVLGFGIVRGESLGLLVALDSLIRAPSEDVSLDLARYPSISPQP